MTRYTLAAFQDLSGERQEPPSLVQAILQHLLLLLTSIHIRNATRRHFPKLNVDLPFTCSLSTDHNPLITEHSLWKKSQKNNKRENNKRDRPFANQNIPRETSYKRSKVDREP